MKTIMDELKAVPVKKNVTSTIEYDCKKEGATQEVFDTVREIVADHLEEIAKITYDINPDKSVKVEVIQHL